MFKVGDRVRVVSPEYFHDKVLIGDIFKVLEIDTVSNMLILTNERFTRQVTWIPDGEVEKIEIKPYVEPEYIVKYKRRLKVLNGVLKICKENSKFAHRRNGYSSLFHSKVRSFKREATLIQTILRQHNEMKRMFAKMRG